MFSALIAFDSLLGYPFLSVFEIIYIGSNVEAFVLAIGHLSKVPRSHLEARHAFGSPHGDDSGAVLECECHFIAICPSVVQPAALEFVVGSSVENLSHS